MFDEAIAEIKLLLAPLYKKWVETGEWQHIPFFHAQPPTVDIILRVPQVRSRFETFLQERRNEANPQKFAETDYKVFRMCEQLHDLLAECSAPAVSKKDAERNARHFLKAQKGELQSLPGVADMEMPKLHHGKKDETETETTLSSCLDFVSDALDTLSEEIMEHESYEHFLDEKCWNYVDVLKASLQQTVDKDGYVQYPSLAAVLHSPTYGHLIMDTLKGTEKGAQMKFLLEAQDFYEHYATKPGHKLHSQQRKDMVAEARRLYEAYFVKSDLELPKRVKNDIVKIVHSSSGKMNNQLFQVAGAWIFNKLHSPGCAK